MRSDFASRRLFTVIAAGVLAVVVGGCGSSNSSSSSSTASTSAATTPAFPNASKANVEFERRPTSIGLTTPVGAKIPTGKKLDFVQCGVPACVTEGNLLEAATKLLGWQLKRLNGGSSPAEIKAAYQQAINEKPAAVLGSGYSRVLFEPEIAALKKLGIPVLEAFVEDSPGNGLTAVTGGRKATEIEGKEMADYVLAHNTSKSFAFGQVYVNGFETTVVVAASEKKELEAECPSCKIDQLEVPVTSIGSDLPSRVTAFLTAHPEVEWSSIAYSDLVVGLPTALKGASIEHAKLVTLNLNTTIASYMKKGEYLQTGVGTTFPEVYWREIDLLARLFTHQPYTEDTNDASLPFWTVTAASLPSTTEEFPAVPNYEEQFKKLWGL
ncbi:MAG: hypothetical protein ABSB69_00010 [Solirubrobacteraceae bacterium]